MFAIIDAAGWPIWLIIIASIVAVAIIGERLWTLRYGAVIPRGLLNGVVQEFRQKGVSPEMIGRLSQDSAMGRVFAAGLRHIKASREVMKEAIEESGRAVTHDLDRFLTSLGTIAAISPLLGLFGTVVGLIEIFGSQNPTGGNPAQLAHGISVALYNTALGILVAIPSMIFYRYFRAKVDAMVVEMELQAIKLVEIAHGERQG